VSDLLTYVEWWDEAFLPKEVRDTRRKSKAAVLLDDFALLDLTHCKTYKYVQHPVPVKPLGGDRPDEPLTMFLTKKERKRVRKAAREEREREKRDKMMMGLIAAPEPKFKLSNFMKILGDQAVADPSKASPVVGIA
jgi:U4/U6 small nuclear ribonucleoprotein PRP3